MHQRSIGAAPPSTLGDGVVLRESCGVFGDKTVLDGLDVRVHGRAARDRRPEWDGEVDPAFLGCGPDGAGRRHRLRRRRVDGFSAASVRVR